MLLSGCPRLEHAPCSGDDRHHKISHDGEVLENVLGKPRFAHVDVFLDAHGKAPGRIVLDLEATGDPLHGHQEGRFFHGYYDGYGYLRLSVFCGPHLLAAKLRCANIDGAAGAVEETERSVGRIRARRSRTKIIVRADSGFAGEDLMAWCEGNRVDYVLGLARNSRLLDAVAVERAWAEHESTGKPV